MSQRDRNGLILGANDPRLRGGAPVVNDMVSEMANDMAALRKLTMQFQVEFLALSFIIRDKLCENEVEFSELMNTYGQLSRELLGLIQRMDAYSMLVPERIEKVRELSKKYGGKKIPGTFFGLVQWIIRNPSELSDEELQDLCEEFVVPWSVIEEIRTMNQSVVEGTVDNQSE